MIILINFLKKAIKNILKYKQVVGILYTGKFLKHIIKSMFETGFGDGYYMSLWGLNEKDEVCEVVIPFINPELID